MATNEQHSQITQSKIKQMRRIAQRTEIPSDKAELIIYLSNRIKQAEDALNDTEELLEGEVVERQKISKSIELRNKQLEKLYEVDQRGLPQKIKQKLTEILTTTVSQKLDAEQKLEEQKIKHYEYKQRYDELKWQQKNTTHRLEQQKKRENQLNGEIENLDNMNRQHQAELKVLEDDFNEIKEKKEKLQNTYLQMKVALERMGDIKSVLNRFFGNEDLFDEKMQLKEQKIRRVEVVSRQNHSRLPSRQTKNQTKLKPINFTSKNEDEDFWRGDFSKKH